MPVEIICRTCGTPFRVKPSWVGRVHSCSIECRKAATRAKRERVCEQCGNSFQAFYSSDGRFCSPDCYTEYRRGLTPEEREAAMTGCRAAITGKKRSLQDLCNRAAGKQRSAKMSDDEREIMQALNDAGLYPIPLYAVSKYNIDFAFPDLMFGIEYNGGNWHNSPKKRIGDEVKGAFLDSEGWTVLTFPRLDKQRQSDSGNTSIKLSELVRQVQEVVHRLLLAQSGI